MAHVHDSPTAAENYFNQTIFGRLYTLMAEALASERAAPGGSSRRQRPSTADAEGRSQARWSGATDRRSLADRLDGWFWRRIQKEREAYLAGSVDVFDLERRIAALQRGVRDS